MSDEITGLVPAEDAIAEDVTPESTGITEEAEENAESSTATPAEDSSAAPKKNRVQERIDELTRQKKEMEREAAYWRQQVEAKEQAQAPIKEPVKPTLESVGYDEARFEAAIEQYAAEKAAYQSHQQTIESKQREQQLLQHRAEQDFQARSAQFAAQNPDYFMTIQNPDLRITGEMAEAIKAVDNGPELAYYLGKNPDLAAKIASLDERRQFLEIGRLQAEISARKPLSAEPSKAPPPIKPVGTKATVQKDPSRMTDKEFAEWRKAHKRR
jgi:DNA repair exonuclease SbcCD ATPase subunit